MRIAKDTPKIIIQTLHKVDSSKLSQAQIDKWVAQGNSLLKQHPNFVRGLINVQMVEYQTLNYPQSVGDLLSKINYPALNMLQRVAAEQLMKNWIKNNLPLGR